MSPHRFSIGESLSFGWETVEADGHDFDSLKQAFDQFGKVKDKPYCIIAHTIKGKGIDFMEGNKNWHGKAPNDEQLAKGLSQNEETLGDY